MPGYRCWLCPGRVRIPVAAPAGASEERRLELAHAALERHLFWHKPRRAR